MLINMYGICVYCIVAYYNMYISSHDTISMTQPALIDTIIKSIGLEDESKQRQTSPLSPPLHTHEEVALFNEKWSYRLLICMLSYLARNTHPNISYIVHQCARYQYDPLDSPMLMP